MTTKRMMMILDRERRADGDGRAKGRHFRGPSSPWPTLLFPFLLLLLLILSTTASRAANHHRRRQTDPHNNVNIVFRYQCPQGCLCVPDVSEIELLIVSCRWPSLPANAFEQFPKNGTKSLTIHCTDTGLDPDHQSALAMPGTFLGFTGLRELKIAGCQSRHLAGHLFLGATRLRSLSLTQMPALGSLEPSFFSHLALLEKLTLAETGLREMPEDGLCPLRHLQVLNFSQNALQSARLGIFLPRPADQLCQLGELLMLDLSANSIQVLAEQDLRPFPALRQLSLRANGMVEIQPDAFRSGPVPLLQHLDLASNRLSLLPAGLPEGLLHLDLANNQFRHQIPPAAAQLAGLARLNLAGNEIGPELDEKSPLQSSALEQLDLSWNQLERIPVGLFADSADSLKTLRLAGNAIERLEPGQMQNLSALQELDLSSNRLAALSFGAFEGLTELAILNLANNSIGQVDAEVFQELGTNLHTLTMSRNQLTELPMAVGRLTRAKRIDLSRNQISKAYKFVLNKLPHLSRLDLGHNALESVDSYVFNGCDHLQELSIRANRIEAISPDAFEKCPRLRRIDLAENRLATLGPAMSGLRALRSVNLTGNGLEELNWAHFPATVLEILANGNGIKRIVGTLAGQEEQFEEETAGGDGRKLKRLELKANRMTRLLADSLPQSLEELDLAENQLASLTNSSFRGMTQLKMVNLRSNKLRLVPKELFELIMANAPYGQMRIADNPQLECNCEMGWLQNASANVVRDIADAECLVPMSGRRKPVTQTEPFDFLCPYDLICSAGCVCCHYENCDCKSRCPPGCECFRDWHSATNVAKCVGEKQLDLSKLPMEATHILLSGLNIPLLGSNTFVGRNRLIELHINSSLIKTINETAFNTLINLKSLHLANNQLKEITGKEGLNTMNIRLLNLANNRINERGLNGGRIAEMMPQLEQLFLEGNSLEALPPYLKSPAGEQLSRVSLAGNPFRCDCSSSGRFDTHHWLTQNLARVLDADRMQCVENLTRANWLNDTTALSARFPNVGDDLFTMPMLEFIEQENSTICVPETSGIFGFGGPFDALAFIFLLLCLLLILPTLIMLAIRPHWFHEGKSSLRSQEEKSGLLPPASNNNSLASTTTHSPTTLNSGSSPIPTELTSSSQAQYVLSAPPTECDLFICYARKDESAILDFCRPLELEGYILCLLHRCGYYQEDRAYFSDKLNTLIKNSRVLVLFLSREFLQRDWNMPQLSSSFKLDKKQNESRRILIIVGDDMDRTDLDKLPDEIGKIILRDGYLNRKNNPRFWEELMRTLPPIRYPSPVSETSQHIYSEYQQIPPAPSEFV